MATTKIPAEFQEKANIIIAEFNIKTFKKNSGFEYYAVYKGDYLYLNRKEGKLDSPIARLKYKLKFTDWDFAIFKWSSERYDPSEFLFPGSEHIDGTIEGALKAGNTAYPPSHIPSDAGFLNFIGQLFRKKG
jgi:hypothetical protein